MTDCSGTAKSYSGSYRTNNYIFVNEVLDSNNLKTFKHDRNQRFYDRDFKPEDPFVKHFYDFSQQPTEKDYKEDACGRRYRNVAVVGVGAEDEYLADESLVVPRYLIVIGPTPRFLKNFKIKKVDAEVTKNKSLNFESENIKDEFANLYHEMIENESWYVKYKQLEDKLVDIFFQQIESESCDGDHYKDLISCLIMLMKKLI